MQKPQLVIMAAGLGSRYGGLKQMAPVDPQNHWIIDYSIFDAVRAGFGKIILIVKPENEELFRETLGKRIGGAAQIEYVHQRPDILPQGFSVPEGRVKPWGTGHAALCAESEVPDGFICINADDFYGESAFRAAAAFLDAPHADSAHAMVGYRLSNTMTPNGSVARGVCETDENGCLTSITERTKIFADGENARYTENGTDFMPLPGSKKVSMNFWIFNRSVFGAMREGFEDFLKNRMPLDPLKKEFYLPDVPQALIRQNRATFTVLPTEEKWFGMTYIDDLPATREGVKRLIAQGRYPEELWK
jgi:NDP-sugar pyrophosphorylase family protein